jgi:hypothetical protein
MTSDNKLQELYELYLGVTDGMVGQYGAMEVAGVMTAIALSIYRSGLTEEEYNNMIDAISANRKQVKTFEKPVLQ